MELYEIKNGLNKAHLLIEEFYRSIDIESYRREIEGLTIVTEQDNFWDDANKAKITYDKLNKMKKIVDQYDLLAATLNNLDETYELVKSSEEVDAGLLKSFAAVVNFLNNYSVSCITNYSKAKSILKSVNSGEGDDKKEEKKDDNKNDNNKKKKK